MYKWKVEPTYKKSIVEQTFMRKGDNEISATTVWRWGVFFVYTETDSPPILESGVDIYDCGYESEIAETWDGDGDEYDYDECDEETIIWLNDFFENDHTLFDLEEYGWEHTNTVMTIESEMEITKIEEYNSEHL